MISDKVDVLQLCLFRGTDAANTNFAALYDLAPRFVRRTERNGEPLKDIDRDFSFGSGGRYRVVVTPARLKDADGRRYDALPTEREQLVEDVVRKIALDNIYMGENDTLNVNFTLYRVHKELQKHRHQLNLNEIKEALEILHKSVIEITHFTEGKGSRSQVVSASAFPVLAWSNANDPNSTSHVQLNPFLAQAIRSMAIDQIDYSWMMEFKSLIPRWLFKHLCMLKSRNGEGGGTISITASQITQGSGVERARLRDGLAEAERAVRAIQDHGVISHYLSKDIFEGRAKKDVVFTLALSTRFLEDRKKAQERGRYIREMLNAHGGTGQGAPFIRVNEKVGSAILLDANKVKQDV